MTPNGDISGRVATDIKGGRFRSVTTRSIVLHLPVESHTVNSIVCSPSLRKSDEFNGSFAMKNGIPPDGLESVPSMELTQLNVNES